MMEKYGSVDAIVAEFQSYLGAKSLRKIADEEQRRKDEGEISSGEEEDIQPVLEESSKIG
jgi:hypothetical protein